MRFNPSDSYETNQKKLAALPADKRLEVLAKMLTCPLGQEIDITIDKEMYYTVNRNRVPMEELVNNLETEKQVQHAETMRSLNRSNNGFTDKRQFRLIGGIPYWLTQRDEYKNASPDQRQVIVKNFIKQYHKGFCYVNPNTI